MRLDRIELYHVRMPLIAPWRTAYGQDDAVHSVLCRLTSGSVHAWGESAPLAAPCYSPEWASGVFAVARDWMGPALLGRDITSGDDLQEALRMFKGNPFAKALFDTAWWALASRIEGRPLHEALGATRRAVAVGADFGVQGSVDELLTLVGGAVEQRYPRIKLKFCPGWDVEMLTAVRAAFPDATLHIDCNSGYRLDDAPLFEALDACGLAMIEQPLQHDDLSDHAALQQRLATPICLDESVTSVRRAEQAIALGSCRYVNVKPGRVGGLTPAVRIHDRCSAAGVPCWVGGMLESALGAGLCAALAMLDNFTYPADVFPSTRFYHEDLCDPPSELGRDAAGVPTVEALDHLPEPNAKRLARWTVQRAVLEQCTAG